MAPARQLTRGARLERRDELERIDAALGTAREGEGAVVLVEGPAGIGKTRLVAAAQEAAAGAGMTVLAARGLDIGRDFQWGVVRQLLEPALAARSASEPGELLAGAAGLRRRSFRRRAA